MLKQALITLGKLCLFKAKPQDLGFSMVTFYVTIVVNLVILAYSMSGQAGIAMGTMAAAVFVGVLLGYMFLLLKGFKLHSRFVQTATAILGCNALMMLVAIVISFALVALMNTNIELSVMVLLSRVLMLTIFIWTIAIMSFIFKNALERNWLIAGLSAIFMLVAANLSVTILLQLLLQNVPIAN